MEIVKTKITSSKGRLAAAIHYPDMKTDQLAILCPGYLDSKDYKHMVSLAEALSKRGYTVVRFDSTGTWESEGDISDYTTTQYLEDIKNVLEFMLKQSDYKQILLGGHSRGGMVSILYAARDSRISLVLGIMPSSKRTLMGMRREGWKETGINIEQRDLPDDKNKSREFRVPYSHVEDRDKYDVIKDVKKIKVPVVFIAGELDESALPEYVKEIFDNANEPKKFITIPGIGHDYRRNDDEIKILNKKVLELIGMKTIS
jgi:pimeloyl-ACP methyl ester carboxylesterase